MMKAKSRLKTKRDNDTLDKMSEDSRSNIDADSTNKVNESFEELRITEDTLQQFYNNTTYDDISNKNKDTLVVRYELPPDKQKPKTKKICVLRHAPENVPAEPSSTLLEQVSIRLDENQRPVQHSILGSLEDFFKMSVRKNKLTLQEIPPEFINALNQNSTRRPITSNPATQQNFKNKSSFSSPRKSDWPGEIMDSDTKALKLWATRMMERRNLQNHISKKVQRVPEELILNSGDEYRKKVEHNYIVSKSIPFYGSGYGYRYGSEFWKQNEVVAVNKYDQLHMSNTQTEKGYPPPILHVGVANQIKLEKGVPIHGSYTDVKLKEYANRRYNELKPIISELDPHLPYTDELIITGAHITNNEGAIEPISDLNDFSETLNKDQNVDTFSSRDSYSQEAGDSNDQSFEPLVGPCLVINDYMLNNYLNNSGPEPLDIRILFTDYTNNKCSETICFQNRGSSIIRFWWKKLKSYDPFELENKNIRRFYFNTQDKILLPNQELNFPVIFKSDKSGIFSEQWQLETLPRVAYGQDITISFKGVAMQRDTMTNIRKKIDKYLNDQVASEVVRGILDDILQSMHYKKADTTVDNDTLDSEEEIFNARNKSIIYNTGNVNSLKKLHLELIAKDNTLVDEWDLNCGRFRLDIYNSKSSQKMKKEDTCAKFYKHIDSMMFSSTKSNVNQRELLYRIGYRMLIKFGGDMFTSLAELRRSHNLPDMDVKLLREKKGSNLSRQRTNNSQSSKVSKKQNESRASVSTAKLKSKEVSILLRDQSDALLTEIDENERLASRSASDVEDQTLDNELSSSMNPNVDKYHTKSYQMVYSLLNVAIDNIVDFWDEISQQNFGL